jgi:hypothetical protein
MDCNNIIMQGEEAKYAIFINETDFDMDAEDFAVELFYGMMGKSIVITKEDMIAGTDGKFYFSFDTSEMTGRVTAECTYYMPDTDDPDGLRTVKDRQMLCFVVNTPLPMFAACPVKEGCEHKVEYERTSESDVASHYAYLLTSRDDRVITDNNEYVLVLKDEQ